MQQAYESQTDVPRLRKNIDKRVKIPAKKFVLVGKTITNPPRTGILRDMKYAWDGDDTSYSCEITLERAQPGDTTLNPKLSPEEVEQVTLID